MIYNVDFPGLGIKLKIDPVAFVFKDLSIRFYGIMLAVGFLFAFLYVMFRARDFGLDKEKITDVLIFATLCGMIGARLYYVVFYPGDFYKKNFLEIFNIRNGGIAIYGGIIGGVLGGVFFAKFKKVDVIPILDVTSIGLLLGQAIGRWGNFFNQEAFGAVTDLPWRMASEGTGYKYVHPCFLYESIWCILGFIIIHMLSKSNFMKNLKGSCVIFYIFWYGTGRIFIEHLRSDSLMLKGIKISQLISLGLVIFSILIITKYFVAKFRNKKMRNK